MDTLLEDAQKLHEELGVSLDEAVNILLEQQTNQPSNPPAQSSPKPSAPSAPSLSASPSAPSLSTNISSKDWQLLSELDYDTLKNTLKILEEDTYNAEIGQGYYPYVEYAIGLAQDRKRAKSIKIKEIQNNIKQNIVYPVIDTPVTAIPVIVEQEISESEMKKRIRDSWINKVDKPKQ